MGPSNPSGRRSEQKRNSIGLVRPKLARKIRFSFGVQDLRGTIGVDAAAPVFDFEAAGCASPDAVRTDRRLAEAPGEVEHVGRLAKAGNAAEQCADELLALLDRQTEMRGARGKIGMVEVIGLHP